MGEKERDQNTTLGKNILNFALIIRLSNLLPEIIRKEEKYNFLRPTQT